LEFLPFRNRQGILMIQLIDPLLENRDFSRETSRFEERTRLGENIPIPKVAAMLFFVCPLSSYLRGTHPVLIRIEGYRSPRMAVQSQRVHQPSDAV